MTVKEMIVDEHQQQQQQHRHEVAHEDDRTDRAGEPESTKLNGCEDANPIHTISKVGVIELGDVTPHNIKLLRRLNQVIFPVSYNDKFYKDVLESGPLAKLAYYNDIMVGAVCCRVDSCDHTRRLYIMTLGCLASYRRLGIGSQMLRHVLDYVAAAAAANRESNFESIFLHVQVNNQDAIEFYQRFGFEIVETRKNYYKRIEPPDAHVLSKSLNNSNNNNNNKAKN